MFQKDGSMKRKCSQCGFNFIEKTTQYWKRIKTGSKILCKDCERLNNASEHHERREKKKLENIDEKLTIPYLIKKYKISFTEAVGRKNEQR